MIRALNENWALFAGMLVLMAGNGLLSTLLTVQGASLGFSETAIGVMQACYPLGALFGCAFAPKLVERVGHIRAFGALASLCSISAIVHLLTSDVWSWGAMRFLAGLCFPGLYVISESWLNAKAKNRSRATILSIYFVIQTLGSAIGQSLAGLNDPSGAKLFGLTSILISLSLVPLLVSRNLAPDYSAPERLSFKELARTSPMAVFGTMLNGAAQAAFYVALPLFGLALGMDVAEATSLLVVGTIAGALTQFPVGWVSDRLDRRLVVAGVSILSTITCVGMTTDLVGALVYPGVALIAGLTLPVYSICVAHANDHLRPSQIVPASGTLVLTLNIGILFGAFAGPFVIGQVGALGLMVLLATLSVLTALVALIRRARTAPPEETGTMRPIAVHGAQTAGVMHPDSTTPNDPKITD